MKYIYTFIIMTVVMLSNTTAQIFVKPNGSILESKTNSPIIQAHIYVEGTNMMTFSDESGYFSFVDEIELGTELVVNALGYKKQIVKLENSTTINIKLEVDPIVMEEIIVQESPLENIGQSNIIQNEVKATSLMKNVSDLFIDEMGFGFVKRGSFAVDPVFRGFKYSQLNVQYDGGVKVMHACPNRMDPITTHIIPEQIEKIELIRGPFSTRFGPNFGGVINMITNRGFSSDEMGFHGLLSTGYETNGNSIASRAKISYGHEKYDFEADVTYRDFDNYEDGRDTVVISAFNTLDYSLKMGYNPTAHQRIQLGWMQSYGKDILHAGLPMDSEKNNSSIASIDYKIRNISSKIYSFTAKAYGGFSDHLMTNADRKSFFIMEAETPVTALTTGGKLELALVPTKKSILYLGMDLTNIQRDGERTRLVKRNPKNPSMVFDEPKLFVDSIWQNSSILNTGFFLEGKYELTHKISLNSGLRFDINNAKIEEPTKEIQTLYPDLDNINDLNISGNLALSYQLSKRSHLQLALGRGVRSANMEERFINHLAVNQDPHEYVGNPLLKSEANHQVELDFSTETNIFSLGANIYYSYITDYISAVVDSSIKRKYSSWVEPTVAKRFINLDEVVQTGFEAYITIRPTSYLQFKLDGSYLQATNLDWDEPIPLITPFTGHFSTKYDHKYFWINLATSYYGAQDRIATSFGEQASPAYWLFDLRSAINPIKGWTVGLSVLNILDEAYYQHTSFSYINSNTDKGRIYEPGRSINVFVKYQF